MFFLRALAAALLTHAALTRALVAVSHTPSGRPIFQAPPGSRVQQSGTNMDVFAPNGSLIHVFQNVLSTPKKRASTPARRQVLSTTEASIVFSDPSDTIQFLKTSFVVPPDPKTFESQLLFFGAGVGTLDDTGALDSILRAALQYGGTNSQGGSFWIATIHLEFLPDGGFLEIFDPSVNYTLTPGERLSTSVTFDPNGFQLPGLPTFFNYNVTFDNHPEFSWLEVGSTEPVQVVNLRMEEEGALQPTDYPAGSFVFEQVEVNLTTGFPDVSWSIDEDPTTDVAVKVEKDGSQDAKVALIFPTAY
ncbi:hypothetical protein C8F01DRAFT_360174 [Mycena amicta]|nr:hypothetical protein C8F01DRAFT_360174 [Mycena amicta]